MVCGTCPWWSCLPPGSGETGGARGYKNAASARLRASAVAPSHTPLEHATRQAQRSAHSSTWLAGSGRVGSKSDVTANCVAWSCDATKSKTCSTEPSHVVPHHSTTSARWSLTSLFGWEAVTLPGVAACTDDRDTFGTTILFFLRAGSPTLCYGFIACRQCTRGRGRCCLPASSPLW